MEPYFDGAIAFVEWPEGLRALCPRRGSGYVYGTWTRTRGILLDGDADLGV